MTARPTDKPVLTLVLGEKSCPCTKIRVSALKTRLV
jgi:hypothetical protein